MAAEDVLSLGAGNLNEVVTWMDAQQEQQMVIISYLLAVSHHRVQQEDDLKSACMDGISTEEQVKLACRVQIS